MSTGGAALLLLASIVAPTREARAQGAAAPTTPAPQREVTPAAKPPAKVEAAGSGSAPKPGTVKENVKGFAHEATEPSTLQRIKAHEQELEKKVERTRDRQRQDHGTARPRDAVDLVKSLDQPDGAGETKGGVVKAAGHEGAAKAPPKDPAAKPTTPAATAPAR